MVKVVVFIEIDERLMDSIYPEREKMDFISISGFQILKPEVQGMILKKLEDMASVKDNKKKSKR